nr:glucan 1,4-alpha-maltotetraohydrolase (EC 3.2.1.60) - Pseudomonas stutzeri (fragments) [Stutzerimonas stutzeri]
MSHILRAAVLAAMLLPLPSMADQAGKSCLIRNEANATQVRQWQGGANNSLTPSEGATTVGRL